MVMDQQARQTIYEDVQLELDENGEFKLGLRPEIDTSAQVDLQVERF